VVADTQLRDRGRDGLARHAWQDAYEAFTSLGDRDELTGEDWEHLAEAAWWSAHPNESLEAFERAYTTYSAEGVPRRAGYVALRLAMEHADREETALWNGWLRRAVRLLEDDQDCAERGYLELALTRTSFERGALDEAVERTERAQAIGVRFEDPDLVAFGIVLRGVASVIRGDVERGLEMIDEGTLAAVGGELTPYAAGSIYCITLGTCRAVADLRRAAEWTEAAARWCEKESVTGYPGVCRVQRAEVMRLRGALTDAEDEARRAMTELTAFGRLPQAGAGSYEIGEIRMRLGDLEGAERAFTAAHQLGHEPQPGLALLHLARGETETARASVAAALADAGEPLQRARLLAARTEIALADHDVTDARAAADELDATAATVDAPLLHAMAHQARGATLAAEDDTASAITELRTGLRHWTELEAPFEAAQSRRSLALAHRRAGDEASAVLELRAARESFARLGAVREADRCEELIEAGDGAAGGRRVTRTFMFTDIVGSTDLIGTIGDEAWKDVVRWHDGTLRTLIASHRGELVRTTGDGVFASFADAGAAVGCAVAIQRRLADHRRRHGFAPQVRIGVHTAEATSTADDYSGLGVHEAARVGAIAEGAEILATEATATAAGNSITTKDARDVMLKGLPDPVRVVSIEW
jgi:class 3 adenylate cyclase